MVFRALVLALLCLLMLEGVRGFDLGGRSRELGIADIPPCGLTCLLAHVPETECGLDDVQCQCGNDVLAKAVSACMLANCTMEDTLGFSRVQEDMCNLSNDSKSHEVFLYTCICYPIAVFFVILRLFSKFITNRVRKDDWIIVTSVVLAGMPIGLIVKMTFNGFGEHLWNLNAEQLLENLRYFYIAWATYCIVMCMLKCSLVLFYLDIFPTRRVRVWGYLVLGLIIVNTLVIFFLTIFACSPVNAFWDRNVKGRCMDINALAFANSGSSIAQDAILFVFPLFCIRKLKMEPVRKLAVALMFAIGTFGCVASVIRLHSLFSFRVTLDPTWDYVPVTIWTEIELACGFVCVSLPSVRALMNKIFPGSIFASMNRSRHTTDTTTPKNAPPKPMQNISSMSTRKRKESIRMRLSGMMHRETIEAPVQWPAGWSPRPWSGPRPASMKGHQRLGSEHEVELSHCNISHASLTHIRTCTSPVCKTPPPRHDLEAGFLAGPRFPSQARYSSRSSSSSLTALPYIGCLPDANYSSSDIQDVASERSTWYIGSIKSKAASKK